MRRTNLLCHLHFVFRSGPDEFAWAPEFWQVAQQVVLLHPGLKKQTFSLERVWDSLHYLLSAGRRGGEASLEDNLMDQAIRGGEAIAEHVRGTQGIPIRLVVPQDVVRIADLLRAKPYEALQENYSPLKMEERAVYKFWAEGQDEQLSEWLREYYEGFRRFYAEAAAHGEAVLVCLD
jgi:hypothetical protein